MAKIHVVKKIFIQDIELKLDHIYEIRFKDNYNEWETKTGRVSLIQDDSFKFDVSKTHHSEIMTVFIKEDKIDYIKVQSVYGHNES
jgi:hypothetical protein